MTTIRVLIADDEHLLRQSLSDELQAQMPDPEIVASVADGFQALEMLQQKPIDVAFLDIRMPGLSGLAVAQTLLDTWHSSPQSNPHPPLIIFVTAYDEYAVSAFEAEAVDYILKPVNPKRIKLSIRRLRQRINLRSDINKQVSLETKLENTLAQLEVQPRDLSAIRTSIGGKIHLLPIDDVILLRAEDKYVGVYTSKHQALIRQSLKDLLPRLPAHQFVQIHRNSIVNLAYVVTADRTDPGKMYLSLKGIDARPAVSRSYRDHFKAM